MQYQQSYRIFSQYVTCKDVIPDLIQINIYFIKFYILKFKILFMRYLNYLNNMEDLWIIFYIFVTIS